MEKKNRVETFCYVNISVVEAHCHVDCYDNSKIQTPSIYHTEGLAFAMLL